MTESTAIQTQAKVISDCTEITMDRFISVLVDGKLELLVLEGVPSPTQLQQAWDNIYAGYMDAMGDESHNDILKALQDINIMSWQYQRILTLVSVLTVYYSPACLTELKRLGYPVKYNPDKFERFIADLQGVLTRAKVLLTQIDIRQKELEKIQVERKGGSATHGDFQTMLIALSEYAKYQVLPSQITAYQFAVMYRRMREYSEKIQQQTAAQKKAGYSRN